MPIIAVLRDTLTNIETANDSRKDGPIVANLKHNIEDAIDQLVIAQKVRQTMAESIGMDELLRDVDEIDAQE